MMIRGGAAFITKPESSSLNHPNIVTIYDIAHDRGTDFIVMEYVEGSRSGI